MCPKFSTHKLGRTFCASSARSCSSWDLFAWFQEHEAASSVVAEE